MPKLTLNINKWIYAELLEVKNNVEKHIKDYRFDEASRNAYQFVWHSYCDWYLELSKTVLYSRDQKAVNEVRHVSYYVFKQILILLHPFIPFITEEIWLNNKLDNSRKSFLMLANWPLGNPKKDASFKEVEKLIPNPIKIPMQPNNRSLNLSNAVAVASYEAWRQLKFIKKKISQ